MSEGDPLQNPTQEATGNPGESEVETLHRITWPDSAKKHCTWLTDLMLWYPGHSMFTSASKRDRTRYCKFYEDHGHETNNCIDLRKEIKACVRSGRLAHLAKGAKTHNNNQSTQTSRSKDICNVQIEWNKKASADAKPKNEIHMIRISGTNPKKTRVSFPRITFFEDEPIQNIATWWAVDYIGDIGNNTDPNRVFVVEKLLGKSPNGMNIVFEQLPAEEKKTIRPPTTQLVGFAEQVSWLLGLITLPITLHDYRGHISKTVMVDFMIVRAPSPYNIILGRPGMM
ncbi:hypothetical protein Tco_1071611 [Tanacetum coccineum]